MSESLPPHGLQHVSLFCPPLSPWICSNSCPLSRWCQVTISSSVTRFSWPPSFSAPRSPPRSRLFESSGQSIGASASASVLPVNIQDWLPLGLTGLIFLLSKGLWRVFSRCFPIWKHHFFVLSLLYGPTFTSLHDYWKKHSFEETDLCRQSNVSAFSYAI